LLPLSSYLAKKFRPPDKWLKYKKNEADEFHCNRLFIGAPLTSVNSFSLGGVREHPEEEWLGNLLQISPITIAEFWPQFLHFVFLSWHTFVSIVYN
jgi:hypothetical protein